MISWGWRKTNKGARGRTLPSRKNLFRLFKNTANSLLIYAICFSLAVPCRGADLPTDLVISSVGDGIIDAITQLVPQSDTGNNGHGGLGESRDPENLVVASTDTDESKVQEDVDLLERAFVDPTIIVSLDRFHLLNWRFTSGVNFLARDWPSVQLVAEYEVERNGFKFIEHTRDLWGVSETRGYESENGKPFHLALKIAGQTVATLYLPMRSVWTANGKVFFSRVPTEEELQARRIEATDGISEEELVNGDIVEFVDLKLYRKLLGTKLPLPVYTLIGAPLMRPGQVSKVSAGENGGFRVPGELELDGLSVQRINELNTALFNTMAGLTNEKMLIRTEPIVRELVDEFYLAAEEGADASAQKVDNLLNKNSLSQFGANAKSWLESVKAKLNAKSPQANRNSETVEEGEIDVHALLKEASQTPEKTIYDTRSELIAGIVSTAKSSLSKNTSQRKFLSRLDLLLTSISLPQPEAVPNVLKAFGLVVSGVKQKSKTDIKEATKHILNSRSAAVSAFLVLGMGLGAIYPDQVAQFYYQSIDVANAALKMSFSMMKGLWYLGKETSSATATGFLNPSAVYAAYWEGDAKEHTLIGLTALVTTIYSIIVVPHLATNTFLLVRDLKKMDLRLRKEQEGSWYKAFRSAFIERQRRLEADYLASLSEDSQSAKDKSKKDRRVFTARENLETKAIVDYVSEQGRSRIGDWIESLNNRFIASKEKTKKEISSLRAALTHFLVSYASFTQSGKFYVTFWNLWFGFRSFVLMPVSSLALGVFPGIWNLGQKSLMPADNNGGTRNILSTLKQFLTDRDGLKKLKASEEFLIDLEKAIQPLALSAALSETMKDMTDEAKRMKVIMAGVPTGFTDRNIDKAFGSRSGRFLNLYQEILNATVRAFLNENSSLDLAALEGTVRKGLLSEANVSGLFARVDLHEVKREIRDQEDSVRSAREKHIMRIRKYVQKFDPAINGQVERITKVNVQKNKPQAMARAVRAMIASNIVDKPMELFLAFLCLAGIQSGIMDPIQSEMFSENSWFHLSRYVFATGFIYGVFSGVFADPWMKLQQDELHEGKFEDAPPRGKFKSFLEAYRYHMFKNPENSLNANQWHYIKIIWKNMRAALVTTMVLNLMTLQRFDLDFYILGYMLSYLVPTSGLAFKMEQAFELASSHVLSAFPKRLQAHPLAQAYANKEVGGKRVKFNMLYKLYENVLGYFIGNFVGMETTRFGSRTLSRVLLEGDTFTSKAVDGIRAAAETASGIPGVNQAASACEHLITNKFSDYPYTPPK